MTANVDDVRAYDSLFIKAMQRLDKADFSDYNKKLLILLPRIIIY